MTERLTVLKKRAEFLRVARDGERRARPLVVVQALRRGDAGPQTRFGFTATKKIGGAVIRNRAKRRLREVARALHKDWPPSCDVVLIARRDTATADWKRLLDECQRALQTVAKAALRAASEKPAADRTTPAPMKRPGRESPGSL